MAAADRTRTELHTFLDPNARERHERNVAAARGVLGDERFNVAWQAGRDLSIDQVSAEALAVGEPTNPAR